MRDILLGPLPSRIENSVVRGFQVNLPPPWHKDVNLWMRSRLLLYFVDRYNQSKIMQGFHGPTATLSHSMTSPIVKAPFASYQASVLSSSMTYSNSTLKPANDLEFPNQRPTSFHGPPEFQDPRSVITRPQRRNLMYKSNLEIKTGNPPASKPSWIPESPFTRPQRQNRQTTSS
jgi:hypothetical protein